MEWFRLIWYPLAVPKHAVIMWLAIRNALITGDKMLQWVFREKCNVFLVEG
jgi:hypothetical protein